MKVYDDLSPQGKKLRLRKVIEIGLKSYDLDIVQFHFFEEATNMLYKCLASDGSLYMLKIFDEINSTYEDNLVEVFMIDTLRDHSDLFLPEIIAARDGQEIVSIESKYTDTPKRMVIYKWVSGISFDGNETLDGFYALGQSMAKMHMATAGLRVPDSLFPKRFDKVYYFKDEKAVYHEEKYKAFVSDEFKEIMDKLVPYTDTYLANLFKKDGMQLIHGDLNPWNVMIDDGNISVIDFEDTSYGYAVQDIGITLFYYRFDENFVYQDLKDKLFEGYRSVCPLPEMSEEDIEMIILARRLNFMNYILLISDDPKEYIDINLKRVKIVMEEMDIKL